MSARGLIRATVVDTDDPQKRGRVRLSIPELFLDAETGEVIPSPWCEPEGGGGSGVGTFDVPDVNSVVWAQAVYSSDDQDYQFAYRRGTHGAGPDGSYAPPTALGLDDESVHMKVSASFEVPSATTALRITSAAVDPLTKKQIEKRPENRAKVTIKGAPTSANAGTYPRNKVRKTAGGFVFEDDDTPGQERWGMHHPSGAGVELNAAGVWTQRAAKRWSEVIETVTERVGGDERRRVDGSRQHSTGGNNIDDTHGRKVILAGELDLASRFDMLMQAGGQMHLKSLSHVRVDATGDMALTASRFKASSVGNMSFISGLGSVSIAAANQLRLTSLLGAAIVGPLGLDVTATGLPGTSPVALSVPLGAVLETIIAQLVLVSKAPAVAGSSPDVAPGAGALGALVTNPEAVAAMVAAFSSGFIRSSMAGVV